MKLPVIPANEQQKEKIREQLNEDTERHHYQLQTFKEWIKCEKHLPNDLDDDYLENFLRLCKHDLQKAKKKFESSIICREGLTYLNYDFVISKEAFLENNLSRQCVVVPHLTFNGYRVAYLSFPKEAKAFDFKQSLKYGGTIADALFHMDLLAGTIFVGDYANCTVEHLPKMDVITVQQLLSFVLSSLPIRLREIHFMNIPLIAKPLIALLKGALTPKMKERLFFHDNVEELHKYLEKEVIPEEYGGSCKNLDDLANEWEEFYLQNDELHEKLKKLKLRGPVPKDKQYLDPSHGFGVDGTFRNLQVD